MSVPTLTYPANAATSIDPVPAFAWTAVSGAVHYELQLAYDNTFASPVLDKTQIAGLTYTPSALLTNKPYYWRVSATISGVNNTSPSAANAGSVQFTLTVNGGNFTSGSVVMFNGVDMATTFVSSAVLTAIVPAAQIITAGIVNVQVRALDGGLSNIVTFEIDNVVPVLSSISPTSGTFFAISTVTNHPIQCYAILGSNVFAGANGSGAFISADGGATWSGVNSGLTNNAVMALAVIGTNLFAGTYGGGVFLSSNNGTTWTAVNTSLTNLNVSSLYASGTTLYAGTDTGVFVSTNNGTTWAAINTGMTTKTVNCIAVIGSNLFAGTNLNGVYLSTNAGSTWTAINTGIVGTQANCFAVSGTQLYVAIGSHGFYTTTDYATWSAINTGIPGSPTALGIAVLGSNLYCTVYSHGVYYSTDNGAHWTLESSGSTDNTVGAILTDATRLFAGTNNGKCERSGFTLTATGTSFVPTSVVKWVGSARTTTYVGSTSLTALITANDLIATGTQAVTVFTPTPGGGTSSGQNYTVS
jgi:hypothetical protein